MSGGKYDACYASATWRRVRLIVLARDKWVCRIRVAGCTNTATTVDHIVPLDQGGAWYDTRNLRAACVHCNSVRGNTTKNGGSEDPPPLPPSREW